MTLYEFCLRGTDGAIRFKSTRACADVASAWRVVGDMAGRAGDRAQGSIVVKDDCERLVILVGVASARALTRPLPLAS